MHWNNRIVKYADGSGYGLHEVYYEGNKATCMTSTPSVWGESPNEIIEAVEQMLRDAKKPVFEEPASWSKGVDTTGPL